MKIIHDARLPKLAIEALANYGKLIPFYSEGVTDEALAGHPVIFCTPINNTLVVAPNAPVSFIEQLQYHNISFTLGISRVGVSKKDTAAYNIANGESAVIHNFSYTDPIVLKLLGDCTQIHTRQGLARCATLPLRNNHFITSDPGVAKKLKTTQISHLWVDATPILLPSIAYGCIGGCMGVYEDTVFIIGSLLYHPQGALIREYISQIHYKIVELYDGPLFDGGSIILIP